MNKIRVMIVEDSRVVREFLQHIIGRDPRLEVAAAVDCAEEALRILHRVAPDVISMDIHLPGMNGCEATQRIMEDKPTPIVVVSSSMEAKELHASISALRAGALTVVDKPVGNTHEDYESLAERLCTQLAIMSQVKVIRQRFNRGHGNGHAVKPGQKSWTADSSTRFRMLGVVASTGGPSALQTLLGSLGDEFPLPIVLVQHITDSFHRGFVEWLNDTCPLCVTVPTQGEIPQPGHVYVAPADHHLKVDQARLTIDRAEPVCAQRPSGTVLFGSMARSLGAGAIGVLLTGMGCDGAEGLKELRDAGGYCIAESASTAVVYGMPAAAVERGAVCESLPLHEIAPRIQGLVSASLQNQAARPDCKES